MTPIRGARCPDCGGDSTEWRRPRGEAERVRATLAGRRPYRCRQCRRRFYCRLEGPPVPGAEATSSGSGGLPSRRRREAHWYVDLRAGGLPATEIWLAVLVILIVAAVGVGMLLLLGWR